ncbi:DNA polymerase subunit beta [Candidatus Bathyarchaeota archaeon]|nr:MAG: DNA polymerase subunit beta [Candidatus Bathyarchaeota archaeon]
MIRPLADRHIDALAYGSIARGDVSEGSDIDIFIPRPPSPTLIEAALERSGIAVAAREIVQATPSYAAKGYIYVGERRSYSFPLVEMRPVELEFYGFAGSVGAAEIEGGVRAPGVDKRLMLIEPTPSGHVESPVPGREGVVARFLGVSVAVVLDRVRTLRRRERVGRTGVFLKRSLAPEESFGEVFEELSRSRPALRRRLRM